MSATHLVPYQFKPGQSGNPSGLKPGTKQGLRAHFNRIINKKLPENVIDMLKSNGLELQDDTFGEAISHMVAVKACGGDLQAVRLLADFTEATLPKEVQVNQQVRYIVEHRIIDCEDTEKDG